jgi:hypothetical protein
VEITVERRFCPSKPDKCEGCEWEDITETGPGALPIIKGQMPRWEAWLDELRDLACTKDDDADDEARERYHEEEG